MGLHCQQWGERNCRCSLQGLDRPYRVVAAPASGSVALPPDRPAGRTWTCLPPGQTTNNQLPIYCARRPDPSVWQIDALAFQWDGLLAYAFPPFSLIPRVLAKIEQENCRVLLIALFWPRQPWFPRLINLLVHRPVILPRRADILYQPSSDMLHPALGGSAPDLLGAVSRSLRSAGLSRRAATFAAHSRRASTRKVYGSRLHHFFRWCRQRSPYSPTTSAGEVGDFLLYLFDSGLKMATVKNYPSAIFAIHEGFPDGSSVPDNRAISQLVKGMFVTRPPTRQLVPSWDLFSVLSTLSQPPFEPISNVTLLQLSIKVVFLLAVATSRRRSELHSLSVATGHIRWEPGGVRLIPVLGFLQRTNSNPLCPRTSLSQT